MMGVMSTGSLKHLTSNDPLQHIHPSWVPSVGVTKTLFLICLFSEHYDVIKQKHFPPVWPYVPGIHRSPVHSPRKGQWRGALMFSLICVWINGWVNKCEAGDLRRHRTHYGIIVMGHFCFGKLLLNHIHIWHELLQLSWVDLSNSLW